MDRSELKADQAYYIRKDDMYFYTPDGVGGFWYDTIEALEDQHGYQDEEEIEELFD
jgi:hypothetical protein